MISQLVNDALRCGPMCGARRPGFQQRSHQSVQHVRLGGYSPEKIKPLVVADEQCRKGFYLQITDQISLVFDINPDETAVGIGLYQCFGYLRKDAAIGIAGTTPVCAQTNYPRTKAEGRLDQRLVWAGRVFIALRQAAPANMAASWVG